MPKKIDLSIVVAVTHSSEESGDGLIGNQGELPWKKLPSDLGRFVRITKEAGVVIMGRKTWESIPEKFRPLVERTNIVVTRQYGYKAIGAAVVDSPEEACKKVADFGGKACIIGGAEIYKLFLPLPQVTKMYVTVVYAPDLKGDVYFPKGLVGGGWKSIKSSGVRRWHSNDEYETELLTYSR